MPTKLGSYYQSGYRNPFTFVYPVQGELLTLINESLNPFVEEVTIRQLDLMSVNADGSLRSSTGRLAAPELGQPPVKETDPPAETGPVESAPVESGPVESSPVESAPVESGPVESGPVDSPPVDSGAVDSQPPANALAEPGFPAAEAGEGATGWGETSD